MDATLPTNPTLISDVLYRHRFRELDGLRGIASLVVGIAHALEAISIPATYVGGGAIVWTVKCIFNGGIAVDLFFLMSGFFLAGMMENVHAMNVPGFYLRRIARLAPPAIAAVGIFYFYAIVCLRTPPLYPNAGPDIVAFYNDNKHLTPIDLLLNFLLVRHTLNPALWTIRIEILASILFPILFFIKNLTPDIGYKMLVFFILSFTAFMFRNDLKLGADVIHYLYIFYAGALLRERGEAIAKLRPKLQYALFGGAVFLLILTGFLDPTNAAHPFIFDFLTTMFGMVIVAFIGFGTLNKVKTFLLSKHIQFLGSVSYSFYLLNMLAVRIAAIAVLALATTQNFGPMAALALVLPTSAALTLITSIVLNALVERPSVALSRYIGQKST